jgi:hypothetical protein
MKSEMTPRTYESCVRTQIGRTDRVPQSQIWKFRYLLKILGISLKKLDLLTSLTVADHWML